MSSDKLQPPSDWPMSDDGRSLYSLEDFVETPYPSSTAVIPRTAGLKAGAFADWAFHDDAVTDALGNELEVKVSWNALRICIEWRPKAFLRSGTVWIGLGTTDNEESERWEEVGPTLPVFQSWEVDAGDLTFQPTDEKWWFEILIDTTSRTPRSE